MIKTREIKHLLARRKADHLVFVDVGSKGKLEVIEGLEDLTEAHAFEPGQKAYANLEKKYSTYNFKKLTLNPLGLLDRKGSIVFFLTPNKSMSSILKPDVSNYAKHFGEYREFERWKNNIQNFTQTEIEVTALDDYFKDQPVEIDFLKIDTQGSELLILKGARNLLRAKKIQVIKLEVSTIAVYQEQALFPEIDRYLKELGYTLVDIITYPQARPVYSSANHTSRHSTACGDAIYVMENNTEPIASGLKKCLILAWLGYTSLSLHTAGKLNLKEHEKLLLLKASQPDRKQKIKNALKALTPPILWRVLQTLKLLSQKEPD